MADILSQNIIKDLGLSSLPKKEQEEVLLRIGRIIFESVLIKVMERLNAKEKDELTKLLTEKPNDEKAILDFLRAKIPNFNELVNEEVANFKQETRGLMKAVS